MLFGGSAFEVGHHVGHKQSSQRSRNGQDVTINDVRIFGVSVLIMAHKARRSRETQWRRQEHSGACAGSAPAPVSDELARAITQMFQS